MKLAVIPARGGSKRIPGKNIRLFCGKPILAYSVQAALESGVFDQIIISTDSEEIAGVAEASGAEVPFIRPSRLADDHAVIGDVMKHAIKWWQSNRGSVEYACCIYATAPMLKGSVIGRGLEPILAGKADFAMSVTTFDFPIQRALRMKPSGEVEMIQPEYTLTRSQDLEVCYHDAAQFFWGTADAFLGGIDKPRTAGIVVDRSTVQDIDTQEDWKVAELMYRALHSTHNKSGNE